jgi:16S rRNA (guanine(966)-N(2))-methyltransferase RsmD
MRVITGSARGTKLLTPEGSHTRPTTDRVKEALFSIIQFEVEGRRVLDLFGGTGQLGIEALSRGAAHATIVDNTASAVKLIRENLKRTHLENRATVVQSDYEAFLRSTREQFDIILLDPPYAEKFLENSIQTISEIDILSNGGIIICERPAEKVIPLEWPGLIPSKDYRYGKTAIRLFRKESL